MQNRTPQLISALLLLLPLASCRAPHVPEFEEARTFLAQELEVPVEELALLDLQLVDSHFVVKYAPFQWRVKEARRLLPELKALDQNIKSALEKHEFVLGMRYEDTYQVLDEPIANWEAWIDSNAIYGFKLQEERYKAGQVEFAFFDLQRTASIWCRHDSLLMQMIHEVKVLGGTAKGHYQWIFDQCRQYFFIPDLKTYLSYYRYKYLHWNPDTFQVPYWVRYETDRPGEAVLLWDNVEKEFLNFRLIPPDWPR
jgi:hypothetical protein